MAVTTDIVRTWTAPRVVMRRLLDMGPREDRAVAYLLAGCFLIFVAQWPRLSRTAWLDGDEFDRLVAYEFLAWLIVWPLVFYLLATLLFLGMRVLRRDAQPFEARLALFWAFLAASPMGLMAGLLAGFVGPTLGTRIVGLLWLVAFAVFVVQGLREAGARHAA